MSYHAACNFTDMVILTNRNITKQVYGKFQRGLYNASKIRNERCSTYRLKKAA
jgi:hypothetical protein